MNDLQQLKLKCFSSYLTKIYYFISISFIIIITPIYSSNYLNNNIEFNQLTSINGLSNNTVNNITQDSDGFIWFATNEGLNKFDGHTIKTYYNNGQPYEIPGNFVKQILATKNNKLFVGTDRGACYYENKKDRFVHLITNGFTLGNVVRMIESSIGVVLATTTNGVYIINNDLTIKKISNIYYRDICEHKQGVFLCASRDEVHLININGEIIKSYNNASPKHNKFDFSSENVQCIFKHSSGEIWIGTIRNGLGYYDEENDEFSILGLKETINPLEDNFVRVINEDNYGRLWIGTESGLYIYNIDKQLFSFFGLTFNPIYKGLNDKAIYSIFRSEDNTMWIGTYFGGVNYSTLSETGFNNLYADGGISQLGGNAVSEIIETNDGKLWIGTENGGISIYDKKTGSFDYLKHQKGKINSLSSNNVHALVQDDNNNIWIGTFIGGLNKFNARTGRIEQIELIDNDPNPLQYVFTIKIDSKKRMWVGAISGLYLRNQGDEKFILFRPDLFKDNFIYHLNEDNEGNLWICTYNSGIYQIDKNNNIKNFNTQTNSEILTNTIIYSYTDYHGDIWFGTLDGGLLKLEKGSEKFKRYTIKNGLPNNTIYAITGDRDGKIWFSTNKGLVTYDSEKGIFIQYTEHDGLPGNQFNYKSCYRSDDGILFFGAVNGLTFFDPLKLQTNADDQPIHFTDFKLFNTSLAIGERGILENHINHQQNIHLKYKYNVFTIEYVGINFQFPRNINYAYYLEGFETDWNEAGNKTSATYTNLSPGDYIFKVKVINNNNLSNDIIRTLNITILPPFWLSPWGLLVYFIVLTSFVILYWRYTKQRHNEQLKIHMAQMEKEKTESINQHRLNFFTYISHEFKTPLTIVIATIDQLLEYKEILPQLKEYGQLIRKNAHRLLFLINQLMEFRKIESDHSSLKLNKGDIVGFIRSTFELFVPLMTKKNITGNFTTNKESHIAYFDADKIEKILTNLMSNACNSMQKNGNISIDLKIVENENMFSPDPNENSKSEIFLTIKDNGPGIPKDKVDQVFKPFFSNNETDFYKSGIGLSLVKSLVGFLNGYISFESTTNSGTVFTIQLPLIYNPKPELIHSNDFIDKNIGLNIEKITSAIEESEDSELKLIINSNENARFNLLLVEDNVDLALFLAHHFSKFFNVETAINGKIALQKVEQSQPDIIISDVMMPEMDGFELCLNIKERFETCHIPLILLTARSGSESKIEGLNMGADAYIDKPFNLRELELTIRNILRSRQSIKNSFMTPNAPLKKIQVTSLNIKDQLFLDKLEKTIQNQIDNADYSVELLCKDLLISRTLLHMKMKKITGLSTSEYIRNLRLYQAKKHLESGLYTVSEIAFKVGFADPAYFSKSFKQFFGVSPSLLFKKQ